MLQTADRQRLRQLQEHCERAECETASAQQTEHRAASNRLLADALLATPPRRSPRRALPSICHVIGSLAAGGAERQTVYLARETLRRHGADCSILLLNPLEGAARHYLPLAQEGGVPVRVAGEQSDGAATHSLTREPRLNGVLAAIDPAYRAWCVDLAGEFLATQPDIVHAWLDHANIWAGIAALATGVPRIILSTRNVNPTHFPSLHGPYFREWYQVLSRSPRVTLLANSQVGAADYAEWIGIPTERIRVILNGFDVRAMPRPDARATAKLRDELALGDQRIVLGVFRISEEKQPKVWADAALRILQSEPNVVVLHAGAGAAEKELLDAMSGAPAGRFRMLGVRDDLATLMSASHVLLHASRKEGTPNALVEAQSLGLPVIATRGGGTIGAVRDGATGILCEVGDAQALANAALRVLREPDLHARLSAEGPSFVQSVFGLDRMVDESLIACGLTPRERVAS